jgi:hypothetical protein
VFRHGTGEYASGPQSYTASGYMWGALASSLGGAARRALSLGLAAAAVGLVGACAGSEEPAERPAPEGYGHVHGLGVNPSDDSLFLATHTLPRAEG